ncbi:MAG: hypothetical protein HKP02_05895, partial [Xanthomonadales bacterium]|nr:hypothetical protein [Xanthomonadales bacterium]
KHAVLQVTWTGADFLKGDGTTTGSRLGSGDFTVESIIPAIAQLGAAKVAATDDGIPGTPPVDYTPGLNPDIIKISLDNNRFKESTTPEPIVVRKDELMETWFDVITYNLPSGESIGTFQRREEFVSISCACTLRAADGGGDDGRRPTLWSGMEYEEGEFTGKPYGESASNQQSQYCDVCCRDHHDADDNSDKYRPWMGNNEYINSGTFKGNHPHYDRDNRGNLVVADSDGDTYLEACRLVRKDGFFRVAQDFNMHEVNNFPQDYLVSSSDVTEYSTYVRAIADSELGSGPSPLGAPDELSYNGRNFDTPTDIPMGGTVGASQQLMSRSVYVDTMNSGLQTHIADCFGNGDRNDCGLADPTQHSVYEFYPFFDIQVTHLSRWNEMAADDPVDITDEEIANAGYSRGRADLAGSEKGRSTGQTTIENGNVGLISTQPITAVPAAIYDTADLYIRAGEGDDPPTPSGDPTVEGVLSAAGGTSDAAILTLTGSNDVSCNKLTNSEFICEIGPLATSPTLTVSNYFKNNTDLIICSDQLTTLSHVLGTSAATNETVFALPPAGITGVSLVISRFPCS